jgi:tetratricopeptide (TPR) repeat protein
MKFIYKKIMLSTIFSFSMMNSCFAGEQDSLDGLTDEAERQLCPSLIANSPTYFKTLNGLFREIELFQEEGQLERASNTCDKFINLQNFRLQTLTGEDRAESIRLIALTLPVKGKILQDLRRYKDAIRSYKDAVMTLGLNEKEFNDAQKAIGDCYDQLGGNIPLDTKYQNKVNEWYEKNKNCNS